MRRYNIPTSQKDRPIGFAILESGRPLWTPLMLPIRPENLTITDPWRVTVHNTLGGAYADTFGRAAGVITLSGTTGWRGGEEAFTRLSDQFQLFNRLRQTRIENGLSPDAVELAYLDTLHNRTLVVALQSYTLQRSIGDPLRIRYHIQFAVLRDLSESTGIFDSILGALSHLSNALKALASGVEQLQKSGSVLAGLGRFIGGLARAGAGFIDKVGTVVKRVVNGLRETGGKITQALEPFYRMAWELSLAGRNLFMAITGIANLPAAVVGEIGRIIGGFTALGCNLANAWNNMQTMFDVQALFGASNCSSTGGGLPVSSYIGTNPFSLMYPIAKPAQLQSKDSQRISAETAQMDPIAHPLTMAQAAERARQMTAGIYLT
jgi:hypothetical protein